MFKRYRFEWNDNGRGTSVDFYVHSRGTRTGFQHRACCIGPLPRLDTMDKDWSAYRANEDALFKKRTARVSYCNRTWEAFPGQTCLCRLWDQLASLKFVYMGEILNTNPFRSDVEPWHEDLIEPDELFGRLRR